MKFDILAQIQKPCLGLSTHSIVLFLITMRIFNSDLVKVFIYYVSNEVYSTRKYIEWMI